MGPVFAKFPKLDSKLVTLFFIAYYLSHLAFQSAGVCHRNLSCIHVLLKEVPGPVPLAVLLCHFFSWKPWDHNRVAKSDF